MAGNHGGSRPGAGRKPKADKHAGAVAAAEQQIADRLPSLIENLLVLADGGFERVDEEWAPAGTITRGSGEFIVKVFADKEDDELVLVKRKVSVAEPDRASNQYLVDRILGRATERHELAGDDGGPLLIRVEYADHLPADSPAPPGPVRDPDGHEAV
jgi:hypothetical protein